MIPHALPNKEGSGLRQMPLVAATGRVLRLIVAIGHACIDFVQDFSSSICYKRAQADVKAPNNNRGMTYQSDGNELSKTV